MKVDFTLINPVNHYRKTLVDNLAILNLRAVSEAAGFSTHVIDFQRKFLEEEKTFQRRNSKRMSFRRRKSDADKIGNPKSSPSEDPFSDDDVARHVDLCLNCIIALYDS